MAATAHLTVAAPDNETFTVQSGACQIALGASPTPNIDRGSISPSPMSSG
jgi:hypothetical protein